MLALFKAVFRPWGVGKIETLADATKLPISGLIGTDAEYQAAYDLRMSKLTSQVQCCSAGQIRGEFDKCISLCNDAHELAQRLKKLSEAPQRQKIDNAFLLNAVWKNLVAVTKLTSNGGATDGLEKVREVAFSIFGDAISHPTSAQNLNELIEDRLRNESASFVSLVKAQVSTIATAHKALDSRYRLWEPLCSLGSIFVGILYFGIFRPIDEDAKRTAQIQAAKATLGLVLGLVPSISFLTKATKFEALLRQWRDLDCIPGLIDKAEALNDYLSTLQELLTEWSPVALEIEKAMDSFDLILAQNEN